MIFFFSTPVEGELTGVPTPSERSMPSKESKGAPTEPIVEASSDNIVDWVDCGADAGGAIDIVGGEDAARGGCAARAEEDEVVMTM